LSGAASTSIDILDDASSPFTVDEGRIQIEIGAAQFTRERRTADRADPTRETLGFASLSVRLGLGSRMELQVVHDGRIRIEERDRTTGDRTRVAGLGDVTLRFKTNLLGNDEGRLGVGAMPYVKLPTAAQGIGNDELEGGLLLPLEYELSGEWSVGMVTELVVVRNAADTGYRSSWLTAATVNRLVGARGEVFAEVAAEVGEGRPALSFNTGVAYAISEDLQLDFGANFGLTRAADDLTVFAGFSWRY
jgi:hypothetical protein